MYFIYSDQRTIRIKIKDNSLIDSNEIQQIMKDTRRLIGIKKNLNIVVKLPPSFSVTNEAKKRFENEPSICCVNSISFISNGKAKK